MSNAFFRLGRLLPEVAGSLLAQDCFLCGSAAGRVLVCDACRAELPAHPALCCPVCALPGTSDGRCAACRAAPPAFDASLAVFDYRFPLDVMLQALKYGHRLALARFFGEALRERASARAAAADLIVPMPLHRRRLQERGFNQAVEVARPLARACGVPLELDRLRRVRDTPAQATLARAERLGNLRGAFRCDAELSGLRIVVVDDVMTTGASLDAVARCLKERGAARVENLVLARTPSPD
ncbi:ComF family protein [Thauera phenolivorans]|uniref:ComF family protein n=1 Tax=Thauera phenolivorans TaxID=1792543 RepID=UPI0009F52858|nr:ComF family protein [Thauera phenolivorans]